MQALILAGGKGTRLRPLTVYTPKPIVPVVNRPLLIYQLETLANAGITDITLSLSYQPDKIEDVLGDGSELGITLRFLTEPSPMGTAGAYKFAAGAIRETTVVFNGDILTDLKIEDVIASHRSKQAEATIVLVPVEDPSKFGLVECGSAGEILGFIEKPSPEILAEKNANTINAGVYVLEPSILDLIPAGENTSFEYDVFPLMIKQKLQFFSHVLKDEYWRDLGTPASYLAAHHDFLDGKIDLPVDSERNNSSDVATAAHIDKASIIGEGCVIKPGAQISGSVLGPGVHVDEKAIVRNSVVWGHTRISTGAEIDGAIVGRSCYLGRNVSVRPGAVLGDKTSLPDYSKT